jgi:hypothetical protein
MSRALFLLAIVGAVGACSAALTPEQPGVALTTDAAEYTVRLENGMYSASIGYTYMNRSGRAVSATHCHTPPPPILEKSVGSEWVRAYDPVQLLCISIPHFQIGPGQTYRGTLHFSASEPGRNVFPVLKVDEIPGTYRLRRILRAGPDPEARAAPTVEAISNEFQLKLQ